MRLPLLLTLAAFATSTLFALPQPEVTVERLASAFNWYTVKLNVRNSGDAPLDSAWLGWHYVWADHGSYTFPELDYSSIAGSRVQAEDRDDFSGTAWVKLGATLSPGQTAEFHLRIHTKDWSALDAQNDPSYTTDAVTVRSNEDYYLSEIPRLPFPTDAKQSADVKTRIMQQSTNTLGLSCVIQNTGEVPLRSVSFSWFAQEAAGDTLLQAVIDYSAVPGTTVERTVHANGQIEFRVRLGDAMLPVGASREVQWRLYRKDWSVADFLNDYSFAGISGTGVNPQVMVRSDGLLVGGSVPADMDSDGDGLSDALEQAVGSDPSNASDAPWVGIPDQLVLPMTGDSLYVVYDFSHIPGYGERSRIAVPVIPGTLTGNRVASIRYVGDTLERPELAQRGFVRSGGYFQVHASIEPGAEIAMAIPLPSSEPADFKPQDVAAFRFDTAAGEWQSLAVERYDGAVHVRTRRFSDVQAGLLIDPVSIAAGDSLVIAIDSVPGAMGVVGFGYVNGAFQDSLVQVWGLPGKVRSLAVGAAHSLALAMDGSVYAWGDNRYGQLGNSAVTDSTQVPVRVTFPDTVRIRRITAGAYHNFAEDLGGRIWVWGRNNDGQLGLLDFQGDLKTKNMGVPELLVLKENGKIVRPRALAGGRSHSLALDSVGRLWSWGRNDKGQLLTATDASIHKPAPHGMDGYAGLTVRGAVTRWSQLASGDDFGMAGRMGFATPLTVVWGDGLGVGTPRAPGSQMDGGTAHFAILQRGGFAEDALLPEDRPEDLVVYGGNSVSYEYSYALLYSGGDNSKKQLGTDSVSLRSHVRHVEGARGVATGKNFTALWIPADSILNRSGKKQYRPFAVRVLGSVGSKEYGAAGTSVMPRKSQPFTVEIQRPLNLQKVVRGANVVVRWTVNGVPQDSANSDEIAASAKYNDTLKVVRTARDLFGNTASDTVRVVVDTMAVRNVSVSGGLLYPDSHLDSLKMLTVNLELTDSTQVSILARNGKDSVACEASLGGRVAGIHALKWNGICNTGKWIAEGVYHLDLKLEIAGTIFTSKAPAWAVAGTQSYVGWPAHHDVLAQALDSVNAASGPVPGV